MVCVALNTARTCEFERLYSWLMRLWAGRFVAFREFVAFMGHCGWTFVAFTELVVFMGCWVGRLGRCYSICGIYGALALCVWHLGLV